MNERNPGSCGISGKFSLSGRYCIGGRGGARKLSLNGSSLLSGLGTSGLRPLVGKKNKQTKNEPNRNATITWRDRPHLQIGRPVNTRSRTEQEGGGGVRNTPIRGTRAFRSAAQSKPGMPQSRFPLPAYRRVPPITDHAKGASLRVGVFGNFSKTATGEKYECARQLRDSTLNCFRGGPNARTWTRLVNVARRGGGLSKPP